MKTEFKKKIINSTFGVMANLKVGTGKMPDPEPLWNPNTAASGGSFRRTLRVS
jgi:hypothetical protein